MNTKNVKIILSIVFAGLFLLGILIICSIGRVRVRPGENNVMYTLEDSIMLEQRHMGYITLSKFVKLAQKLPKGCFTASDYSIEKDSVRFIIRDAYQFYGTDEGKAWIGAYKNLPIHIDEEGFTAKLETIDSVEYIYLPYQILSCVANNVVTPQGKKTVNTHDGVDDNQRQTLRNKNNLPPANSSFGKKIQTEGWVLKNVTDILSMHRDLSGNKRAQLKILWQYAHKNWNYVNDPYSAIDTWRSASETIENYYTVNGRCYSGDCDDFAILMASFARQVGYDSHLVTVFNSKNEGHAYAEFSEDGRTWTPMDWFDEFGGKPFKGTVYRIYEDL